MKKKSIASLILKTFFKALGIMALMIAVAFGGYFSTMLFYKVSSKSERSTQYKHVIDVTTGNDSRNLIYSYNEESGLIDKIVLEIYHSDSNNLDYVTIPSGTNIETSGENYTEMLKGSQEVPQIVRLSRLNRYFSGDVAYEYGIMALEDEIGTDIGYFTAIPSKKFDEWFVNLGTSTEPYFAPSDKVLEEAAACSDSYELSDMVEKYWDDLISDITCAQKKQYSASFKKIKPEQIHTYRIYTEQVKKTHTIIKDKTRSLFRELDNNEEYTKSDAKRQTKAGATNSDSGTKGTKGTKDTKELSIQLTNGSQINGLAAAYKEKLTAEGYKILGTGNYEGDIQTNTKILVKKKGIGDDLLSYFSSATIEVTEDKLTDNADIEVIIGTKDRITGY